MSLFDQCFEDLLLAEGGLLISDSEHGGGANMGVSYAAYLEWKGFEGSNEMWAQFVSMSKDEASQFYRDKYWTPMGLAGVTSFRPANALLNIAVNRGKGGCKQVLRKTLEKHFKFWPASTATLKEMIEYVAKLDEKHFAWAFVAEAEDAYVKISSAPQRDDETREKYESRRAWLAGWINRCQNLNRHLVTP
jgi:hypothetical protein